VPSVEVIAKRIAFSCFVLIIASCAWTVGRAAEDSPGERLYTGKCRRCHGPEGGGAQGPALVPFKWTDEKALDLLRHPVCEMPAFSEDDLSDAQAEQIFAYLRTIT
jgi:mono/diheme cytochrome c family protein